MLIFLPVFFASFRQPGFMQGPLLHHTDGSVTQLNRRKRLYGDLQVKVNVPVCLSLSGRTFAEGCQFLYEAPPLPWP